MTNNEQVTTIDTECRAAVSSRFGIDFEESPTGGGCMALEARLESGHWIVATNDALWSMRQRIAFELDTNDEDEPNEGMGWYVGIYPNNKESYGVDTWFSEDSIVEAWDNDAYASQLVDVVEKALTELAGQR
jgi:hypothetical protein